MGIGAAAEGEVKLVTPAELANPDQSGTQSLFTALDDVEYVSTVVDPANMAGTFGTLYVVIEDNDSSANVYSTATQTTNVGTLTGSTTDISVDHPIVDRNRDGDLDDDDIDLEVNDVKQFAGIVAIDPTGSVRINHDIVNDNDEVKITYARSVQDSLIDGDGDSRVSVSSGQDNILVVASEANIADIDTGGDGGVDAGETLVDTAGSTDSGLFLGAFGLIAGDWKEVLDTWIDQTIVTDNDVADAVEDRVNGGAAVGRVVRNEDHDADLASATGLVITSTLDLDLDDTEGNPLNVGDEVSDRNGDGVVDGRDLIVTFTDASGSRRGLSIASVTLVGTTVTVTLRASDQAVSPNDAIETTNDELKISYATTVDVHVLLGAGTDADPGVIRDDATISTDADGDSFLTYPEDRTQALAFDDLERTLKADGTDATNEPASLIAFLNDQFDALYGDTQDEGAIAATAFINRLLGVEDGSDVEVRYRDPGQGTQRVSATADLVAPAISITDPANGSFTPNDRFDGRFSVTDTGSGIPEDAEEENVHGETLYLATGLTLEDGEGGEVDLDTVRPGSVGASEDDDVNDGFEYDLEIDVRGEARTQEDEDENLVVRITITAYDIAGNQSSKSTTFTVDVTDPELLGALTGWGVVLDDAADQTAADDEDGAYVLTENQDDWLVLIFDGPIDGDALTENDVNIGGHSVENIVWLNNAGRERISIGADDEDGTIGDLDFNSKTSSGTQAEDDVTDDNGGGMDLVFDALGQDARHLLFVQIAADDPLATDAEPSIDIDGDDLMDLAGNAADDDHEADAEDRLWPAFTVTVSPTLSNDALGVTIAASEDLDRRPTVQLELVDDTQRLTVVDAGENLWTVDTDIDSLNLNDKGQDDGVYTVRVSGEDENGNDGSDASKKWELDTVANGGGDPLRTGFTEADGFAADHLVEVETDEVVFISFEFPGEANEYGADRGEDSENGISVTGLSLETLDPDDSAVVMSTTTVELGAAQTSNSVKYVVALSNVVQSDYNLVIEFADVVGNTREFKFRFDVIAQQPKTIAIQPGWNLISVPGIPQDSSIASVLSGTSVTQVWSFNNETKIWEFARTAADGSWEGTLLQMSDGRAYFVRSSTFDPAKVLLTRFTPQRTPPQYTVQAGWNGIGYTPGGGETWIRVSSYLAPLGNSWAVVRWWNPVGLRYESAWPTGDTTAGFIREMIETTRMVTDDEGNITTTVTVTPGAAIVEAGKGYMLYTTSDGTLAG